VPNDGTKPFEARYDRVKLAGLITLSLGFVACGLWLTGFLGEGPESSRYGPLTMSVVGYSSFLFFGAVALSMLKAVLAGAIALRIDEHGMMYSRFSRSTVHWSDFAGFYHATMYGNPFLCFELKPDAEFQLSIFRMPFIAANRWVIGYAHAISINGMDVGQAQIVEALKHFAPESVTERI